MLAPAWGRLPDAFTPDEIRLVRTEMGCALGHSLQEARGLVVGDFELVDEVGRHFDETLAALEAVAVNLALPVNTLWDANHDGAVHPANPLFGAPCIHLRERVAGMCRWCVARLGGRDEQSEKGKE